MREILDKAIEYRRGQEITCKYHIDMLDDCLYGIMPSDLILIGADTGVGKTEVACNIAFKNAANKRVHLLALEADMHEPYLRMLYKIVARKYFEDIGRDNSMHISWRAFMANKIDVSKYEDEAKHELATMYPNLTVHYKDREFDLTRLTQKVSEIKDSCDLIVLDHVDYLDVDYYKPETASMSEIMKTLRDMNQIYGVPIVIISHLRKKNNVKQMIPTLDDFFGSSNKTKQVKTVIVFARDYLTEDQGLGVYGTYCYVAKSRHGSMGAMAGRLMYDARRNEYQEGYKLVWVRNFGEEVQEVPESHYPWWAKQDRRML